MKMRARIWLAGAGLLALGLFLLWAGNGTAGGEEKTGIEKIADALAKGEGGAAKTQAKALAKKVEELGDVMNLFKPRNKKGLGVGAKAGGIQPDGIEQQLRNLGRDEPSTATAKKHAAAFEKMGYRIAAVAEVTLNKAPSKDKGKMKVKDWVRWAKDMNEGAKAFVAAAKSKSPAELKKAAAKIDSACNNCHSVFRD